MKSKSTKAKAKKTPAKGKKTTAPKTARVKAASNKGAERLGNEQRRQHARFETSMRVEYMHGDRKAFAFSVNVSQAGMLLRNASGLALRQETDFYLALSDGEAPLQVRGRVIEMPKGGGARVQFAEGQKHVAPRLKRYTAKVVVPHLEAEMKKPHVNVRHVAELAGLYSDAGKFDDAMDLFRAHWKKRGPSVQMAEHWVRLMAQKLGGEGKPNATLMREMEMVSEAGLALGSSALLAAARSTVESLRSRMERQTRAHDKRERDEKVTERVQSEVAKRMKDTLSKALVSQKQEVEAQLARKLRAADEAERLAREAQMKLKGKARATESLLVAEKARLESEREALEAELRAAQKGRKSAEKRELELQELQEALESKSRDLQAQKEQMAVRMRELKAMEEQQEKLHGRAKKTQQLASKVDEERAALTVEREQLAVEREAFNQVQNAVKAQKKGLTKLEETLAERAKELDKRATEMAGMAASNDAKAASLDAKAAKRKAELDAKATAQEVELEAKRAEMEAALEARFASRQVSLEQRLTEQNKSLLREQQAALDAKYAAMETRLLEQNKMQVREQQTALEQKQAAMEARIAQQERAAKDRMQEERCDLEARAERQAKLLAEVESRAEMLTSRSDEVALQERDLETRKQRLEEQERQFKSEQAVQDMRYRDLQQELLDRDAEVKRLHSELDQFRRGEGMAIPSGKKVKGTVPQAPPPPRDDNPFDDGITRMVAVPPAEGYGFGEERTMIDLRKPAGAVNAATPGKTQDKTAEVKSGFSSTIVKNTFSASGDFTNDYTRHIDSHVEPRIIDAVEVVDDGDKADKKGRNQSKRK